MSRCARAHACTRVAPARASRSISRTRALRDAHACARASAARRGFTDSRNGDRTPNVRFVRWGNEAEAIVPQ